MSTLRSKLAALEKAVDQRPLGECPLCHGYLRVTLYREMNGKLLDEISFCRSGGDVNPDDVVKNADGWYCRGCGLLANVLIALKMPEFI